MAKQDPVFTQRKSSPSYRVSPTFQTRAITSALLCSLWAKVPRGRNCDENFYFKYRNHSSHWSFVLRIGSSSREIGWFLPAWVGRASDLLWPSVVLKTLSEQSAYCIQRRRMPVLVIGCYMCSKAGFCFSSAHVFEVCEVMRRVLTLKIRRSGLLCIVYI